MSFSLRKLLFSSFLAGFFLAAGTDGRAQSSQPPVCSPEQLDVKLAPQPDTAATSDLHRLAVEIENRSQATCLLAPAAAKFTPDNNQPWETAPTPDLSQVALAFKEKSQQLGGGQVAHLLLAWSSAPIQINGLVIDNCTGHDEVTPSSGFLGGILDRKPLLEVRNLQMQSCGHIWLSSYRLGPYVPGEPISDVWLERSQLPQSDFSTKVVPESLEIKVAAPGAATLRALSDIEYLKATPVDDRYSGIFNLLLSAPSRALANCPFRSLRKREADGQTTIYLNHCTNSSRRVSSQGGARGVWLWIRDFGLLPERVGLVEYDTVSDVLQAGKPAIAYARTDLSIRDPRQPMLPAIDTGVPECLTSQLKVTSPAVELGSHWDRPRVYAPLGQEWRDGKVFEFTNVSDQNCMLGGVPELKALNAPEVTSGSILVSVCRNCSTPLFDARESRWVDLLPNESAHFMVVRSIFDSDFACNVMGGLEMSLPGDKQAMRLPFEVGLCGQLRVSAWREGRYDGDPMNVQYDRDENDRKQRFTGTALPLPSECTADMSLDTGRPVTFRSEEGLIWGLSTKSVRYGDTVPMLLWVCNTTDKPLPVMTCAGIGRFWLEGIDVFDSSGQRVLSIAEENEKKARESGKPMPGGACLFSCTRNFPIFIPPHSSVHASFSNPNYDFVRDLRAYYSLPPGRYYVVPSERGPDCEPSRKALRDPKNGLLVVIGEV